MGMNDAELVRVIDALQARIGAPFSGAWQPARDRVVIGLGDHHLLIVPRGPFARLHTIGRRPRNPPRPFSFQGALRAHLGGRLVRLDRIGGDRVVDLVFDRGALRLRLTGRSGGLWLVDGSAVVAAFDGPAPEALPSLPPRPPAAAEPRFLPEDGEDWDRAARRYFQAAEQRDRLRQGRIQLQKALRTELQRTRRLQENLERDLDRASRAPALRRQADALAATLHTLERGADTAVVADLEDPDRTWTIGLDPAKPATATMEKLYRQARRLDRAGDQVLERMEAADQRVLALEGALEEVADADREALTRLRALVPARRGGAPDDAPRPFITWTGPAGQVVLVGRNAKANRKLTFQTARGTDWWMHLRGVPGAHVVLRMNRDQTPSLPLLLAGAQIALVHGRIPEGSSADVQYTRVRDVRSIPGEAEGRVRLASEKVLHVARDRQVLSGWTRDD